MGNIQSNATKQVLADYTNVVNSTVVNVYNSAAASCASANNFSLQTGGGSDCNFQMINGSINVTQTAGTNCQLNSQNVNSLSAQFQTQLTNNTQQFIQQNSQNKQGWFATAFSLQMNNASNVTEVMNQISNSSSANFTNLCNSVSDALNNATVKLCGIYDGSSFNLNQNALVTAITSCVNQNVVNIWTSNQVLNSLWQATDQKLASTQSGFSLKWILIIVVVIVVLLLISGLAYYFINRHKSSDNDASITDTNIETSD